VGAGDGSVLANPVTTGPLIWRCRGVVAFDVDEQFTAGRHWWLGCREKCIALIYAVQWEALASEGVGRDSAAELLGAALSNALLYAHFGQGRSSRGVIKWLPWMKAVPRTPPSK